MGGYAFQAERASIAQVEHQQQGGPSTSEWLDGFVGVHSDLHLIEVQGDRNVNERRFLWLTFQ